MYAIHSGSEVVVYDTFTSVPHAEFVRGYLQKMVIKKFTVVLSHWHLDHIAGNAVFADCAIVATSLTRDAMLERKADIEAGDVWGHIEVGNLVEHVENLREMQGWDVAKILPNHGDPDVIMKGGFDKTLIAATVSDVTRMLSRAHDGGYLDGKMEDSIGPEAAKGWIQPFEPYREVHEQNLKLVHDYWKDKTLPQIAL
jgi:cyclase